MKKITSLLLAFVLLTGMLCGCAEGGSSTASDSAYIEQTLNLKNNPDQEWTYNASADAWTLSVVSAVAYPELPDQQGVSVCVPGAYVVGIDADGDGAADVTTGRAKGALIIDCDAQIVSKNGQIYTASTAPLLMTTGAAGYGSQKNAAASVHYAQDGYIAISCGNRGKQNTLLRLETCFSVDLISDALRSAGRACVCRLTILP